MLSDPRPLSPEIRNGFFPMNFNEIANDNDHPVLCESYGDIQL